MFGALKSAWRGQSAGGDETKGAAHTRPRSQPIFIFSQTGPEKLWITTQYVLEKGGNSVEKWCTLHLSHAAVQEVTNKFTLLFDPVSYLPYNKPGSVRIT